MAGFTPAQKRELKATLDALLLGWLPDGKPKKYPFKSDYIIATPLYPVIFKVGNATITIHRTRYAIESLYKRLRLKGLK